MSNDFKNLNNIVLGTSQMLMTALCGFIQLYIPCGMYKPTLRSSKPPGFFKHMMFVGCTRFNSKVCYHYNLVSYCFQPIIIFYSCRFTTVILGLVALNFVAVSFTETIKSSAPLFTVLISRFMLGENTGLYVNLSLIPVMSGLALCSVNELSFNLRGFVAAMLTNLTEWLVYSSKSNLLEWLKYSLTNKKFFNLSVQNVYSKMLISGEKFKYT